MTIAELLEASRAREQSFDNLIDTLKNSGAVDRLRFAVTVTAILDKGGSGEAFALLSQSVAREDDPTVEAFKALSKEDRVRVTCKVLLMIEQDKLTTPRKRHSNGASNGEGSTVTDLILNAIQSAKGPITRAEVGAKVREVMPDVNEKTIQGVISSKKADGTLKHHEELHAYTMA
jgi:hypothetical protein